MAHLDLCVSKAQHVGTLRGLHRGAPVLLSGSCSASAKPLAGSSRMSAGAKKRSHSYGARCGGSTRASRGDLPNPTKGKAWKG